MADTQIVPYEQRGEKLAPLVRLLTRGINAASFVIHSAQGTRYEQWRPGVEKLKEIMAKHGLDVDVVGEGVREASQGEEDIVLVGPLSFVISTPAGQLPEWLVPRLLGTGNSPAG